jgi:hypothetical protein
MDTASEGPYKNPAPGRANLAEEERRAIRREQILKRGSIPEFIQVTEMYQIYSAFV